ncbi:MAG: peptidoglycan-binding protein, partial [Clostridia bacterium]|nr:peptidoglycan-binding protein [Clostridia bacterium]
MKNRVNKCVVMLAILCVLVMAFAVPFASAASYSKVYGQTQAKIRVRESASTNATIIDNIVKNACVYVTSSKTSGSNTFIQIKYIASDGSTQTGWVCQSDGKETYVKILSATQAQSTFKVSGGSLPSTKVGTFTSTERKASASNSDSTYIRSGSSGETVKSLQTKLKALGFYSGEITGNVGTKTEAAIKAFQRKYGLTADGIAGPQTIAKIDAAYASSGNSTSSSSSSSSGLKLGSSGTDVRNLQQDLTTLGYYWADITGSFGSKTETAVKRFQEENGLTADGVAGSKTLAAIATAVAKKGGTSSSSSSSSSSGTTLKLNSQGTLVSQLQQDLMQLGYYYAEITGNFGSKTEAAVKKFQTAKGLTADGVAGTKTLAAIASAISAAGGSTSSSSSSSSSTSGLKLGSTGDKVRALQEDLTTLGYYYGDITGHYGSMTQAAVKKFQKARGLTQDGVAGTTTINA